MEGQQPLCPGNWYNGTFVMGANFQLVTLHLPTTTAGESVDGVKHGHSSNPTSTATQSLSAAAEMPLTHSCAVMNVSGPGAAAFSLDWVKTGGRLTWLRPILTAYCFGLFCQTPVWNKTCSTGLNRLRSNFLARCWATLISDSTASDVQNQGMWCIPCSPGCSLG